MYHDAKISNVEMSLTPLYFSVPITIILLLIPIIAFIKRTDEKPMSFNEYNNMKIKIYNEFEYIKIDPINYEKLVALILFGWSIMEENDDLIILKRYISHEKCTHYKAFNKKESVWINNYENN
jgi:hypothetical protein